MRFLGAVVTAAVLVGVLTACGTVVDEFTMDVAQEGHLLSLQLDTDLPDDTVVIVGMGRVFTTPDYQYLKERPTNLYYAGYEVSELQGGVTIDLPHEGRDFAALVQRRTRSNPDWGRVQITPRHYVYMLYQPGDDVSLSGDAVEDGRLHERREFAWGQSVAVR